MRRTFISLLGLAAAACIASLPVVEAAGSAYPTIAADDVALGAPRKHHVLLTTLPFYGHYMPMKAIAEALLRRGHTVTILTEKTSWCNSPVGTFDCVEMPRSGVLNETTMREMSFENDLGKTFFRTLDEVARHQREQFGAYLDAFKRVNASKRVTGILTDVATIVGYDLAEKFNIPVVTSFPMVLHLPVEPIASLPGSGSGLPRDMSYVQRLANYMIKTLIVPFVALSYMNQFNAVRIANGVPPFASIANVQGMNTPVLAQAAWGYDIPHPVCPNVFPLGSLVPAHHVTPLEPGLRELLDSAACRTHGAVYVNFGTLSVASDRLVDELFTAFTRADAKECIVWKPNKEHLEHLKRRLERKASKSRFYVTDYFASPPMVMAHPNTRVFLTHCGDTSVGEAMEAAVPLAGIPMFADQADVCQRITEAGIGQYVGHKAEVTVEDIVAKVLGIARNKTRYEAMRKAYEPLADMRKLLGGAERGAQVAESQYDYRLIDEFTCAHLDPVRLGTVNPADGSVDTSFPAQFIAIGKMYNWDALLLFALIPMWIAIAAALPILRRLGRLIPLRRPPGTPAAKKKLEPKKKPKAD